MSNDPSTHPRFGSSTLQAFDRGRVIATADRVAEHWQNGDSPDLPEAVRAHPALVQDRSVFFDLVQQEYRLRNDEWRSRSAADYCRRFADLEPSLLQSLHRLIEVEQYLDQAGLGDFLRHESELPWPSAGNHFVEFELIDELGRGALSRVFLAKQPSVGNRDVVVKVTRSAQGEANALGRLSHPNVVTVYSTGTDEDTGFGWLCMPFEGRETLDHVIADRTLTADRITDHGRCSSKKARLRQTLNDFASLAQGLAYVHSKGLTHGDLKPSNILISESGTPMLIDFNLAQETDAEDRLAGGTLPYMSPEQLRAVATGESELSRNGMASEVFSFGVVLHHAIHGRLPFEVPRQNTDLNETASRLLKSQSEWSVEAPSQTPHDDLIRRCLALEANDRPDAMQSVAEELHKLATSLEAETGRPSRRTAIATGLALCASAAVGASIYNQWPADHVERAIALARSRKFDLALREIDAAVSSDPDNLAAWRAEADIAAQARKYPRAARAYLQLWRRDLRPEASAMAGYYLNLTGETGSAIASYESARKAGIASPEVDHNLGRSWLVILASGWSSDRSLMVRRLLLSAYQQLPMNESVRLSILWHCSVAKGRNGSGIEDYPLAICELPSNSPSAEFCYQAVRFLSLRCEEDDQFAELAAPCLRLLVAYEEPATLRKWIGVRAAERLPKQLLATLTDVKSMNRPSAPPNYLAPNFPKTAS